ncbi:MAG: hypothetical protein NC200_03045 [Candidatus Gastranaerophilales bacterium]|nr:hypothetical protein [Candidatus Gastranaerophilales bacterium]
MDKIKQLTGKNPKEYEPIASQIINNADVELFEELVSKDDFLFDFVKSNVAQRLEKACNKDNYKNLLEFLDIYSPYYEDFITSTLSLYGDDEVTDIMLERFKSGSDDAKIYSAGFFAYKEDDRALQLLKEYAFSDDTSLSENCARALAKLGNRDVYEEAISKLSSDDDFEQMKAVNFLVAYQDKDALKYLFDVMKKSKMSENIAEDIPYLVPLPDLLQTEYNDDAILTFCYIVNGLVELIPVSQIIDFRFYEFVERLLKSSPSGASAVALFLAKEKFNMITENEEYLFDEDKNTKNEVNDIKNLLNNANLYPMTSFLYEELFEESDFIFFVLDIIRDEDSLVSLLSGDNQTVIIKVMELLKAQNLLKDEYKQLALSKIDDVNLKVVANAL